MVCSTTKNHLASLGCGLMMAMVFHCPRVVTLDLHKACRFFFQKNARSKKSEEGVVMKSLGFYLIRQKPKRWRNWGKESTPLSFF